MAGQKLVLSKQNFETIRYFLESNNYHLPVDFVLELFKTGILSIGFLQYMEKFQKSQKDLILSKVLLREKCFLDAFDMLYVFNNPRIAKFFIRTLSKSQRDNIFKTYNLSPMETYIYNLLYNAKKSNKTVENKIILKYLKEYRGYNITNDDYINKIIKKINDKVRYDVKKNI